MNTEFSRYRIRIRASIPGCPGDKWQEVRNYTIVAAAWYEAHEGAHQLAYREGLEDPLITQIVEDPL